MPIDLLYIDHYEIEVLIGSGGFAKVYRGKQTSLNRRVAIKVLKAPKLTQAMKMKFEEESKTLARLRHPHIVKIYDYGFTPSQEPYLVMDYIPGGSLYQLYTSTIPFPSQIHAGFSQPVVLAPLSFPQDREGTYSKKMLQQTLPQGADRTLTETDESMLASLSTASPIRRCQPRMHMPNQILSHVQQIASALQYAHDQGVFHLNVKPANILLNADKTIVLGDFGIAMTARGLHVRKHRVGTPHYMAPEQFQGKPCAASDQYALAIIVYEWLCGTSPFEGRSKEQLQRQHLEVQPTPLRYYNPTVRLAC